MVEWSVFFRYKNIIELLVEISQVKRVFCNMNIFIYENGKVYVRTMRIYCGMPHYML